MSKWRYTDAINLSRNMSRFDVPDDMVTCPACDRLQDEAECFLGRLGYLTHYRCRYCGMGFNSEGGQS